MSHRQIEILLEVAAVLLEGRHQDPGSDIQAVIPGLVNGHTHLSQTYMRGLAEKFELYALEWPDNSIYYTDKPAELRATDDPESTLIDQADWVNFFGPGATYFVEGQYVAADDAAAALRGHGWIARQARTPRFG